jgi:hypothetical protein
MSKYLLTLVGAIMTLGAHAQDDGGIPGYQKTTDAFYVLSFNAREGEQAQLIIAFSGPPPRTKGMIDRTEIGVRPVFFDAAGNVIAGAFGMPASRALSPLARNGYLEWTVKALFDSSSQSAMLQIAESGSTGYETSAAPLPVDTNGRITVRMQIAFVCNPKCGKQILNASFVTLGPDGETRAIASGEDGRGLWQINIDP